MRVHADQISLLYTNATSPAASLPPAAASPIDISPPSPGTVPTTDTSPDMVIPKNPAPSPSSLSPSL